MALIDVTAQRWRITLLGITLAALGICAITQYWGLASLGQVAAAFRHGDTAFALATEDMRDDILQLRRFEKDVLLNVGSADSVQSYWAKWDDSFLHLRYDLARARRSAPEGSDPRLQGVVDAIATYHTSFEQTYEGIKSGMLATPQQANSDANRFRAAARNAESLLNAVSEHALAGSRSLQPALQAQRYCLIVCTTVFAVILVLLLAGMPRLHPASR